MKRTVIVSIVVLFLLAALLSWAGIGFYTSSSAVRDLETELASIYGAEYTGKAAADGTEDMVFEVVPKTWFLTNWNLRSAWSLDYKYECRVIFTAYDNGRVQGVRTIIYQAADPMGAEKPSERASLDLTSKAEKTEIPG